MIDSAVYEQVMFRGGDGYQGSLLFANGIKRSANKRNGSVAECLDITVSLNCKECFSLNLARTFAFAYYKPEQGKEQLQAGNYYW